ncbi:DUF2953 domain-containing protein [Oceanobacillus rekensis]|uniref:DUF2953 domain-containing protein n=1 Tax=Oceanobacillus rekensis TaxID=937927 RepID=UPI000B435D01|nr:DUF2953 domain-containing protein [Oceanobacillus rekensis]
MEKNCIGKLVQYMLLVIICLIAVLLLLVFFSKIVISIQYTYELNKQFVTFSIIVLRIRIFKKKYDLTDVKEHKNIEDHLNFESFPEKIKTIHQTWKNLNRVINKILQKVRVHHFSWVTTGGTGDAFTTGMASGGIWSVKGILTGFLFEKIQLKCRPYIHVEPNFQQRFLQSDLECMISIRFGQAIHGLIKIIKTPIKLQN